MRFGETRRGFESPPLRHPSIDRCRARPYDRPGRARRGTSGALHPQSATAGLNSRSRPSSLRLPRDRPTLKVGSHAAKVREPRQVRKEAAVSDRLRVPWGDLAGAGRSSRVRALAFDTGCTAVSTHPADRRHRLRGEAAVRCTVAGPCRPLPPTSIGRSTAAGGRSVSPRCSARTRSSPPCAGRWPPTAPRTPTCSSGRAAPARPPPPGSWPRPSTAPTAARMASRATPARPAWRCARGAPWT